MATNILNIEFQNNSGFADSEVSIGFLAGPGSVAPDITNPVDNSKILPLQTGGSSQNWYTLDTLGQGAEVTQFSGRIYICYGTPWSIPPNAGPGYEPGQTPADPNFYLRYDKMEMTFTGSPFDVANLTSIDYWSIPMSLNALKQGTPIDAPDNMVMGLKTGVTTVDLYKALVKLTTPPQSGLPNLGGPDGGPLPALVPGIFQQLPPGPVPGTEFARIIGPSSYPPVGAIPVTPYNTMQQYLTTLKKEFGPGTVVGGKVPTLGNGVIAKVAGIFAGVGANPTNPTQKRQSYSLEASIDDDLNITLTGELSVMGKTSMEYQIADLLNPSGIYGGNAPFLLNQSKTTTIPVNDVYGWITGDLMSGIIIGTLGSTTKVLFQDSETEVGAIPSQQWFEVLDLDQLFGNLQSEPQNYNQWAAALQARSDDYNFAYTDRFAPVFVTLAPERMDTLQIILEDAIIPATVSE